MANVGRKAKFTEQEYLDSVKKIRSINDKDVAGVLGVNTTTVYRFRLKNPEIEKQANVILEEIKIVRYDGEKHSIEVFRNNPSIKKWVDIQLKRRCHVNTINDRTSALYNVCKHLGVSPDNLTVDACSNLVHEAREKHESDESFISGLAYHTIRKPIRIWFMYMKGIAGELLTNKGIDAGRSKGTGSMATERVTEKERKLFWDNVPIAVNKICINETEKIDNIIEEIRGIAVFMYYTATRITATTNIKFNDLKSSYNTDMWEIHCTDKGKRGGIEWDKLLRADGLNKMRQYVKNRFGISIEVQDNVLPTMDEYIFPWIRENIVKERVIMKEALRLSSVITKIQNHIWRHTFAQDWLEASDWNYELGASIGGWTDTGTMKLSYGKINKNAIVRGLKKAMGEKVEDVTYELRW